MGVFGAKWGKGWCDVDPNELSNTFEVLNTSVPILVKIGKEMQPCECPQTDTQIH